MWKGWSPSRKLATVTIVLIGLLAVIAVASSGGGGSSSSASTSDRSTSTTEGSSTGTGGAATTSTGGEPAATSTSGGADAGAGPGGAYTIASAQLPLTADISNTNGLHDGDVVSIDIAADKGSLIYGAEMRMCKKGTKITDDGQMLPTATGWCISKALSPGADGYKVQAGERPYDHLTATYKVGEGTDTYTMDDGSQGSVTCDKDNPCVLAVKFQVPNGFGFRTYPLTFS